MNQMPSADYNLAAMGIDAKLCKHLWLYLLNKARPQDAFKSMQGVRWRKQASADAIQNTSPFSFYSISFKCAFSARKKKEKKLSHLLLKLLISLISLKTRMTHPQAETSKNLQMFS